MGSSGYSGGLGFWYAPGWLLTGIRDEEGAVPSCFGFDGSYPNPFNPVAALGLAVPSRTRVDIRVYDVSGREVAILVSREFEHGYHYAFLDGSGLSSGVCFARMVCEGFFATRKMVLLK